MLRSLLAISAIKINLNLFKIHLAKISSLKFHFESLKGDLAFSFISIYVDVDSLH